MDIVRHRTRRFRYHLTHKKPPVTDPQEVEKRVVEEEEKENRTQAPQSEASNPQLLALEKPEAEGRWTRSTFNFYLGLLTTFLVLTAWITNLVAKPLATAFGGTVSVLGMLVAFISYRHHKQHGRIPVITTGVEEGFHTAILAILTPNTRQNHAVVDAVLHKPTKQTVVFLYLGIDGSSQKPEMFRMVESHLNDPQARIILGHVNHLMEHTNINARFIYRHQSAEAVKQVWELVHPDEVILASGQSRWLDLLPVKHTFYEESQDGKVVHAL